MEIKTKSKIENYMRYILTIGLFLQIFGMGATTVVPFPSLKSLHEASTYVVYANCIADLEIRVIEPLKGSLPDRTTVSRYGTYNRAVSGDIQLTKGEDYLLFLDENMRPMCLNLYVYWEVNDVFTNHDNADGIIVLGNDPLSGAFDKEELLQHLRRLKIGRLPQVQMQEPQPRKRLNEYQRSTEHCTWLTTFNRVRWDQFPVTVSHTASTTCAGGSSIFTEAMNTVNMNYRGIEYIDAGLTSYSPNCSEGTAFGGSFTSAMPNRYNGVVFFDDPCDQISDLSGCSGVLAIGGAYSSGGHIFNDEMWASAAYPFVVMNNGLETCHCGNIVTILTHELTHTMGIGHIHPSNGQANMNPSCCSDITDLDRQCLDLTYPVKTNIFVGMQDDNWHNALNWTEGIPDSNQDVDIQSDITIYPSNSGEARTIHVPVGIRMDVLGTLTIDND